MDNCHIQKFCYVCGSYTSSDKFHIYSSNETFQKLYKCYFDEHVVFEKRLCVPDKVCDKCNSNLNSWSTKKMKSMPFKLPMIWFPPMEHDSEKCYGCKNFFPGIHLKKTQPIKYQDTPYGQRPMPYEAGDIPPKCPSPDVESWMLGSVQTGDTPEPSEYVSSEMPSTSREATAVQPVPVTQQELNNIVAKLELSIAKSEILASFLKEHKILSADARVTQFRKRGSDLQKIFSVSEDRKSAFCNNIELLMIHMGIKYDKNEWRLFIDSATNSLKAVLLHITNEKPIIPIGYSTDTKETYERMKDILEKIEYNKYNWRICCDLKVVAILCGLQAGWTKRPCFLCDWDSRYEKGKQYECNDWKPREESVHKEANVINPPLVPRENILLPPLHVKLGIVMSFLKEIVKNSAVFDGLKLEFPRLSENKIKQGYIFFYIYSLFLSYLHVLISQLGVVNGPDIRKLRKSNQFERVLYNLEGDYTTEYDGWKYIQEVIDGLLGKNRAEKPIYEESVRRMLESFQIIGVNMSLKIHLLHHHLDYFGAQASPESDEQGERFHQVAMPFEKRYLFQWFPLLNAHSNVI